MAPSTSSSWRAPSAPRSRPTTSGTCASAPRCWSPSAPAPPAAASRRCVHGPATTGGIDGFIDAVYADAGLRRHAGAGARRSPSYVEVDAELRGCPIDTGQLVELLTATAIGRRPQLPDEAVCVACKRAGRVCVMVARVASPAWGPSSRPAAARCVPAWPAAATAASARARAPTARALRTGSARSLGLSDERSPPGSPASRPGRRSCARSSMPRAVRRACVPPMPPTRLSPKEVPREPRQDA